MESNEGMEGLKQLEKALEKAAERVEGENDRLKQKIKRDLMETREWLEQWGEASKEERAGEKPTERFFDVYDLGDFLRIVVQTDENPKIEVNEKSLKVDNREMELSSRVKEKILDYEFRNGVSSFRLKKL